MNYDVTGLLVEVYPVQQVTEKFAKREFVLETQDGAYKNYIKFQLNQAKVDLIEPYKKGDTVTVSFNLSGRQYTDRNGQIGYITNLIAWRIKSEAAPSYSGNEPTPFTPDYAEEGGDLPF